MAGLPVAQQLAARGFALQWFNKTKLDAGGMQFTLPAQPVAAQAQGAVPVVPGVPVTVQMTPVGKSMQRE